MNPEEALLARVLYADGHDVSELVNEIPLITWRRGCDSKALSIMHLIATSRFGSARIEMSIDSFIRIYGHRTHLLEYVGYKSQGDLHRRIICVESS